MEVFKRVILQPRPPQAFALQTVQEVIKPQETFAISFIHLQYSWEQIMQYGHSIDDGETTRVIFLVFLMESSHS
nr:hypothetical protein CFP56_42525 [Quercus suber]